MQIQFNPALIFGSLLFVRDDSNLWQAFLFPEMKPLGPFGISPNFETRTLEEYGTENKPVNEPGLKKETLLTFVSRFNQSTVFFTWQGGLYRFSGWQISGVSGSLHALEKLQSLAIDLKFEK